MGPILNVRFNGMCKYMLNSCSSGGLVYVS